MTVIEYCRSRIGRIWTEDDTYWIETQVLKQEHLFEECMHALLKGVNQ